MATVKPFSGWHYDSTKIKSMAEVVVPPYDVISPEELKQFKALSPYNYSHIILAEGENKHKAAAKTLKQWCEKGLLIKDKKPSFYFYRQSFVLDRYEMFCQDSKTSTFERVSFFARVGLEDYIDKIIFPHEKTFSGPKADRYILMDEIKGNAEPVFLGYNSNDWSGEEWAGAIKNAAPLFSYSDKFKVKHELWAVSDEEIHKKIEKFFSRQALYILDGHHRYETALKYSQDRQKQEKFRYLLANLCSFKQEATVILPTHRLIRGIPNFKNENIPEKMKSLFDVTAVKTLEELEKNLLDSGRTGFGLKTKESYYLLTGKAQGFDDKLDLDVLHENVLPLLGKNLDIAYYKDIPEFEKHVNNGQYEVGFLVKPTKAEDVIHVAHHMQKMPHKSTFFYPKIPSGLLIHLFE